MTSLELFNRHFGRYISLSDEMIAFLEDRFEELEYAPRELIVEGGAIPKYFYFVKSGVQMLYLISESGEKVVLGFSFDGDVSGVYDAFATREPSTLFLEALTPSKMIGISHSGYTELFESFPELYKWRTHFTESILFGRLTREREMMTHSAKERFDAFVKRCPPELLQIPQKYLASYLNMKPETFSRLRALRD